MSTIRLAVAALILTTMTGLIGGATTGSASAAGRTPLHPPHLCC